MQVRKRCFSLLVAQPEAGAPGLGGKSRLVHRMPSGALEQSCATALPTAFGESLWSQGQGDGQLVTIHALGICKKIPRGLKSLKDRRSKPPLQRSKISEHSQVGPPHTRVNCSLRTQRFDDV